jgi:hypothetical protein
MRRRLCRIGFLAGLAAFLAGPFLQSQSTQAQVMLPSGEWNVVPSPNAPNQDNFLNDVVAISPEDAWAVGYHEDPNALGDRALAQHWDGMAWSIVSAPGLVLNAVAAASSRDVWAVGADSQGANVLRWDGTSWSVAFSVPHDAVSGANLVDIAASSQRDVWVVGAKFLQTGRPTTLIAHWDGAAWQIVLGAEPPGARSSWLTGVSPISPYDVWAVGSYTTDNAHPLTEHWDGRQWRIVPTPDPSGPDQVNTLDAVAAVSHNQVWTLGRHFVFHDWRPFVLLWRHKIWNEVPTPELACRNSLVGVAALASHDVWGVGSEGCPVDVEHTLTEHWDGKEWQRVHSPDLGAEINRLTSVSGTGAEDVWAVGYWYDPNGRAVTMILHRS